jgi:hypothetical protein
MKFSLLALAAIAGTAAAGKPQFSVSLQKSYYHSWLYSFCSHRVFSFRSKSKMELSMVLMVWIPPFLGKDPPPAETLT